MQEENANGSDFQRNIKSLVDTSVAYYKLWLFRAVAKSATSLVKIVMVTALSIIAIVFLSVAAAIAIGYAMNNFAYGFLIIGVCYVLVCVLLFSKMDKLVDGRIIEKFSEHFKD
ncbi:MAG TPA: competence protein [Flavobacterium sp.]|jgi:hypothetical protein|nr:competence protein [Flavobacterium sp.]